MAAVGALDSQACVNTGTTVSRRNHGNPVRTGAVVLAGDIAAQPAFYGGGFFARFAPPVPAVLRSYMGGKPSARRKLIDLREVR